MQTFIAECRRKNKRIGFVATMGALHKGHCALMHRARKDNDVVIASIFVNPTQFGPTEDFQTYPRTFEHDVGMLAYENVDALWYPTVKTMYPYPPATAMDIPSLTQTMCGVSRPTHFQGVLIVVAKLLNIVQPDVAYFGQKDFQQARVIETMVRDLNIPTRIVMCPIVREHDGLAMSSRNVYLSLTERKQALCLWHALSYAQTLVTKRKVRRVSIIEHAIKKIITDEASDAYIDYIAIRDAKTLQECTAIAPRQHIVIALAVFVGKTRLIDNILARA